MLFNCWIEVWKKYPQFGAKVTTEHLKKILRAKIVEIVKHYKVGIKEIFIVQYFKDNNEPVRDYYETPARIYIVHPMNVSLKPQVIKGRWSRYRRYKKRRWKKWKKR